MREGVLYGIFGVGQWLADWLCFVALTTLGIAVAPANLVGRVLGAGLGFWVNGRITFAGDGKASTLHGRSLLRFLASWLACAALSTLAVVVLEARLGLAWAWSGKLAMDALLAGFGFMLSKYWIYR